MKSFMTTSMDRGFITLINHLESSRNLTELRKVLKEVNGSDEKVKYVKAAIREVLDIEMFESQNKKVEK